MLRDRIFILKGILLLSFFHFFKYLVRSVSLARSIDKPSKIQFLLPLQRRADKGDDEIINYSKTGRNVILKMEKNLREPKPIPTDATKSRKRTFKKQMEIYQAKKIELAHYK